MLETMDIGCYLVWFVRDSGLSAVWRPSLGEIPRLARFRRAALAGAFHRQEVTQCPTGSTIVSGSPSKATKAGSSCGIRLKKTSPVQCLPKKSRRLIPAWTAAGAVKTRRSRIWKRRTPNTNRASNPPVSPIAVCPLRVSLERNARGRGAFHSLGRSPHKHRTARPIALPSNGGTAFPI